LYVAFSVPTLLGSKVTVKLQVVPALSDPPQGGFPPLCPKSALLVPEISAPVYLTLLVWVVRVGDVIAPRHLRYRICQQFINAMYLLFERI
jgi:hypothetical protein